MSCLTSSASGCVSKISWLTSADRADVVKQILEFVDEPKTFVRASQVSRRWLEIVSDDQAWKTLGEKHAYHRLSVDSSWLNMTSATTPLGQTLQCLHPPPSSSSSRAVESIPTVLERLEMSSGLSYSLPSGSSRSNKRPRAKSTHRMHFKHRYLVESAWKKGGHMTARHIAPDQGVVTSLHLTKKYIIVALDNAKIHVFNTRGEWQRTLQGHQMGVWAMVPWDDILVSGGCDRDVRVWNMATGGYAASLHLKLLN